MTQSQSTWCRLLTQLSTARGAILVSDGHHDYLGIFQYCMIKWYCIVDGGEWVLCSRMLFYREKNASHIFPFPDDTDDSYVHLEKHTCESCIRNWSESELHQVAQCNVQCSTRLPEKLQIWLQHNRLRGMSSSLHNKQWSCLQRWRPMQTRILVSSSFWWWCRWLCLLKHKLAKTGLGRLSGVLIILFQVGSRSIPRVAMPVWTRMYKRTSSVFQSCQAMMHPQLVFCEIWSWYSASLFWWWTIDSPFCFKAPPNIQSTSQSLDHIWIRFSPPTHNELLYLADRDFTIRSWVQELAKK